MPYQPRHHDKPDPHLAAAVTALGLHSLLPNNLKKAASRLKTRASNRDAVLEAALCRLVPPASVESVLPIGDLDASGDFTGLLLSTKSLLQTLDELVGQLGARESETGLALVWRLAFFELAVRTAAASFALDPATDPRLRPDLWAADDGFRVFIEQLWDERGVKRGKVVDQWVERAGGGDDVEKSQLDRWLYEGALPQPRHIEPFARAIALGADDRKEVTVPMLRFRIHLFLGCRVGFENVAAVLGDARARSLSAAFARQVRVTFEMLQEMAISPPAGPVGPIDPRAWKDELRQLARKAAVFGVRAGSAGAILLDHARDLDLQALLWPQASIFFAPPTGHAAELLDVVRPGLAEASGQVSQVIRTLSLDDLVIDASKRSKGRQPLGWLGLLEGVLGSRMSE